MSISWDEITVSLEGIDSAALLLTWRWLVPEGLKPVVLTAMGDLFLLDPATGEIQWLDVASGELTVVASSGEDLQELMSEEENAQNWFMPEAVTAMRKAGSVLGDHQVYSLEHPAILGGEFKLDNIMPTDVYVHFNVHGQIHEQVKDLPEGTEISIDVGE